MLCTSDHLTIINTAQHAVVKVKKVHVCIFQMLCFRGESIKSKTFENCPMTFPKA